MIPLNNQASIENFITSLSTFLDWYTFLEHKRKSGFIGKKIDLVIGVWNFFKEMTEKNIHELSPEEQDWRTWFMQTREDHPFFQDLGNQDNPQWQFEEQTEINDLYEDALTQASEFLSPRLKFWNYYQEFEL